MPPHSDSQSIPVKHSCECLERFGHGKCRQSFHKCLSFSVLPGKVTVDVSQDLHEVQVHRGEANAGGLSHVDGALLCQVHVIEVDELKLGLLLWPEGTEK